MSQYVYWHAPLWEVLLAGVMSLALLGWLVLRTLRRPDPATALCTIDPILNVHPLFFFDRVRGVICLNDAATQLLRDLSANQRYLDIFTGTLLEAYEEGRVSRQEGRLRSDGTLIASPLTSSAGNVKGVLALMTSERPLPLSEQCANPDIIAEQRDWLIIGDGLRVHLLRPIVHVQRCGLDPSEGNALSWQEYQLSYLEDTLLRYLLKHPAEVQPAEVLFKAVWLNDDVGGYGLRPEQQDRLRRLVYQLRQHIEPDPRNPRFVVTAHGIGYGFYPTCELAI